MAAGQPRHILIGSSPAHGRPSPAGAEPEGLLLRESNASPAAPSGSSPQGTGNSRKSTRLAFSKQALDRLTRRLRRPFPGPPSTRWRGHRPSTRDIHPLAFRMLGDSDNLADFMALLRRTLAEARARICLTAKAH